MKLVPREDKEPTAPDLTLSIGAVPSEVAAPPAPPVQSETPDLNDPNYGLDSLFNACMFKPQCLRLRSLLAQREERIRELADALDQLLSACKAIDDAQQRQVIDPHAEARAEAELARMKK